MSNWYNGRCATVLAKDGQVIACTKFMSFLTPDIALKTMSDMALSYPSSDCSMTYLTSFLNAISGIKKLTNFIHAINCLNLTNEASIDFVNKG